MNFLEQSYRDRSSCSFTSMYNIYSRVRENEYVKMEITVEESEMDETIASLTEAFCERIPKIEQIANEIQDEANAILPLLRDADLTHVLFDIHHCWLDDINVCVYPCDIKIKDMFEVACNLPSSQKVAKLHYLHIVNKEMQFLIDGFKQYNHVFRLFLMQTMCADQCDYLNFYPHEEHQMEE